MKTDLIRKTYCLYPKHVYSIIISELNTSKLAELSRLKLAELNRLKLAELNRTD